MTCGEEDDMALNYRGPLNKSIDSLRDLKCTVAGRDAQLMA